MDRPRLAIQGAKLIRQAGLSALIALAVSAGSARAQTITADVKPGESSGEVLLASTWRGGPGIIPHESAANPLGCYGCGACGGAGCNSCGGCGGGGCGGPGCIPGRIDCCEPCQGHSMLGRLLCGIHHMLCCPDPCYEPCYIPAANAAFFQDSAKPLTQTKFRYDALIGGNDARRAGYYSGPGGPNANFTTHELFMENEFAIQRFSFFVSTPFRIVAGTNGAGYADMRIGTKSLLVDTELLLASFQFTTYLPTGIEASGTGNGNVGIEPALLLTLKIAQETYLQTELAEWIGLLKGNTNNSMFHYHFSLNHTLTAPRKDMKLIGTVEFGSYVSTDAAPFYNVGPGFRFHFCNKLDVGFGMQFAVSNDHFYDQLYRTELRWRF